MGALRGKIGPVVGSSWMGEPYVRSRGRFRTKKRGLIEKHNQNNFALLHRWLQPLLPFLKEGFKGYAPRLQGFKAAKSYGLKHAFVGERGNRVLDPSKLQVSFGSLPLPSHLGVEKLGRVLQFEWDSAVTEGGSRYDQAMLLAYDNESGKYNWKLTGQFREAGRDVLELPHAPGAYHVYIAFIADDRSRQSHSVYLGRR